jgi:multiple sugar transport system permease protein
MIKENKIDLLVIYLILLVFSLLMVLPFLWMILTSVKEFTEVIRIPFKILPEKIIFANYPKVFFKLPFLDFYINTFVMIAVRVLAAIIFSSMAAYAFARIKFPLKNVLFFVVLMQMMVPPQIFIIPQYLIVAKLGWLNSIKALIFPGLVSAFGTFLLRQFFMSVPRDLDEAALIDGSNPWQIYWNIMLPLVKTGCVALGIFTALFAWKDLMWPLIVNMSIEKMTLSAGLASLQGQYLTDYPTLMAGAVIAIWPMLLIFVLFQRQFIEGIAITGIKG